MQKYVAEFLGTLFIVLALGLTGDPIASGLFIIALVYMGGRVSGAHYNPAITFAFWVSRGMPSGRLWRYIGCQFTGACAGILIHFFLMDSVFLVTPSFSSSPLEYSLTEAMFTSLLAIVYLTVFLSNSFRGNRIYGLVIGLSYAGMIILAEPISGAIFNPAIAMAMSVVDLFNEAETLIYLPAYILSPLIGGLMAGLLFNFFEND